MRVNDMRRQIIFLAVIITTAVAAGAAGAEPNLAVTIYTDNFAVVRETRNITFTKGLNKIKLTDVASAIEPASVNFQCLSAPGAVTILEQNYQYDLAGTAGLLRRYIDKNITVSIKGSGADAGRELAGVLLAVTGDELLLKGEANSIEIIDRGSIEQVSLKEPLEELAIKPTLVWLANTTEDGNQLCRLSYTTAQVGWSADYSAELNSDETKLDFSGWVTIDNKSGTAYNDADIKLIAGDVRRITEPRPIYRKMAGVELAQADTTGFEEAPFMEYHLYTLGRKSTIDDNQVKQIELIRPVKDITTKKLYIYERGRGNNKVQVKLEFQNTTENKLGVPLPAGKVRVYKKLAGDGALEFVGEDRINHTAEKEKLSLYVGNAFDIAAEYTLLEQQAGRRMRMEKHKIELRNRKDSPVTVFVDEKFPQGVNWVIDESTHKYEKRDAYTARFEVKIEADSTATVEYTATQRW
jgi:hypothetical protein